jgi:hypothetical protein
MLNDFYIIPERLAVSALLNQGMNANCAGSRAKVSLALGFKNTRKEYQKIDDRGTETSTAKIAEIGQLFGSLLLS